MHMQNHQSACSGSQVAISYRHLWLGVFGGRRTSRTEKYQVRATRESGGISQRDKRLFSTFQDDPVHLPFRQSTISGSSQAGTGRVRDANCSREVGKVRSDWVLPEWLNALAWAAEPQLVLRCWVLCTYYHDLESAH